MFYERHQHAVKVMRIGARWSSLDQATHVRIGNRAPSRFGLPGSRFRSCEIRNVELVSRVGIEPTTRRLRVCCSAN